MIEAFSQKYNKTASTDTKASNAK